MLCNLQGETGTCVENSEGAFIKAQVEDDPKMIVVGAGSLGGQLRI